MASKEDTWKNLPIDLQERFYYEAEEEAGRLLDAIAEVERAVDEGRRKISNSFENLKKTDRMMTIAAIDSSRSVTPGEKLGARFTVYSVGMVVVRGLEKMEEPRYGAGRLRTSQSSSSEFTRYLLALLQDLEERKMALHALERGDVDLVLIDGSFFGFSYEVFRIRREGLMTASMERLLKETYDATQELINSRRCIGVVKRSRTRAIGGFLSYKEKRRHPLVSLSDKFILTLVMPPSTILKYPTLLTGPQSFKIYSRLATQMGASVSTFDFDKELDNARRWVLDTFIGAFQISKEEAEDIISSLNRMYVRIFKEDSPFEMEYPTNVNMQMILDYLGNQVNFNEATGLPIALDMVDELVSIPREFTRDFAQEVEARIAQKYDGKLEAIRAFFTNLNPQKEI
ncbi:MAG: DNA double-strand break repair nuclease NurA [Nitrososphaerales archaeon]|nr:DNA double-strand break repair nuclease NurA [Nitrososphaerales archaeon]